MYLTPSEFKNLVPEHCISDDEFLSLESRAENDINAMTFDRICYDRLTDFQKEKIHLAVAAQMKFISENSELIESALNSYSISGVSMSFDKSKVVNVSGVITTNQVYNALMQTGLCYRGLC